MSEHDTTYYRTPDGTEYRVIIRPDEDAMSPRDADNVTVMVTDGRRFASPDKGYVKLSELPDIPSQYVSDGVDMRRLSRYVNLFGKDLGIIALAGLDIVNDWQPTLRLRLLETDADADATYDGYIAITNESWVKCMGDTEPTATLIEEVMAQDVDAFNVWARGEYVGVTVERREEWINARDVLPVMHTWEPVASVWGYDSEEYAKTEALGMLPEGATEIEEEELP